jgi:hypothetical protein
VGRHEPPIAGWRERLKLAAIGLLVLALSVAFAGGVVLLRRDVMRALGCTQAEIDR